VEIRLSSWLAALAAGAALAACSATGPYSDAWKRSDDLFRTIQPGMTEDQVRQVAGKPDDTMAFPLSHTHAWDYLYYDSWGYMAIFSVTFDADGRAVSKFSRRINDGGDHGGK
jgi:outer membrane protein assembly factor BamE (lipoprotein component of BamABCDE complex)